MAVSPGVAKHRAMILLSVNESVDPQAKGIVQAMAALAVMNAWNLHTHGRTLDPNGPLSEAAVAKRESISRTVTAILREALPSWDLRVLVP